MIVVVIIIDVFVCLCFFFPLFLLRPPRLPKLRDGAIWRN